MQSLTVLGRVEEKLLKLRRILERRIGGGDFGRRVIGEVDRALSVLERIRADIRADNVDLARAIEGRVEKLLSEASKLPRELEVFYEQLHLLRSYIEASYYDFTSRLTLVRRGYRLYVASTVTAMVLMPIFFSVGFLVLGVYVLGLMISIHAFRARRRLGPLIAAALLPLALFTAMVGLRYSAYALSSPAELARVSLEAGVSLPAARLMVTGILAASLFSLIAGTYSFYVILRHRNAFV